MYAQPTLNGTPVIPTTYANITTFGNTSVKIIPIPATYQSGYLAGQGFPAENENYLMFNLTNSVNAIANDLANIHAEILTVLSGQSIPVDNGATQLNSAIGSKITSTVTGTYINNALTGAGINTALIAYGGNIGIGRSPSSTLDVNGNINGNSVSIAGVSIFVSPTFTGTVIVPVATGSTSPTQKAYVDQFTLVTFFELTGIPKGITNLPAMSVGEQKLIRVDFTNGGTTGNYVINTPITGTFRCSGISIKESNAGVYQGTEAFGGDNMNGNTTLVTISLQSSSTCWGEINIYRIT